MSSRILPVRSSMAKVITKNSKKIFFQEALTVWEEVGAGMKDENIDVAKENCEIE